MKSANCLLYIKGSLYPNFNDDVDFLQIICGLKSSAGAVVKSINLTSKNDDRNTVKVEDLKSAVFVDGRYELAAKLSVNSEQFEIKSLSISSIVQWIKSKYPVGSVIAFDPRFFSHKLISEIKLELVGYKFIEINLNDFYGINSPAKESKTISWELDEQKFKFIYEAIDKYNLDGYLVCDPCSSAWLLNQRNKKTKDIPVTLGYLLITKDKDKNFYYDNCYLNFPMETMSDLISDISKYQRVGTDFSQVSSFIPQTNLIDIKDPIASIKYIKTNAEVENIKNITIEDSEAIVNFLYWFYQHEEISEIDCVNQLFKERSKSKNFIGNSFDTIAAADEHSAIVHYSPTEETNKKIDKFLLLDSGGQYTFGTTDITRTLSKKKPTQQEMLYYTLVLKGHIAVASSRLNKGSNASSLDAKARSFLLQHSLDYNHSTGHGIGYMLSVHEGPVAISKKNKIPLQANIVLSNEPGVYIENHMGVRLENMILTKEYQNFICFDTISLVPFDNKFIDYSLLTLEEIVWLGRYNKTILKTLRLSDHVRNWLKNYIESDKICSVK